MTSKERRKNTMKKLETLGAKVHGDISGVYMYIYTIFIFDRPNLLKICLYR